MYKGIEIILSIVVIYTKDIASERKKKSERASDIDGIEKGNKLIRLHSSS